MSEKSLRILVVDDHQEIRALLAEYLASSGCWVESCPDAATALARLEQDGFDVLLTHLQLPDADGRTWLQELTRRGHRPPRVLSMSGGDAVQARQQSQALGCAGHLAKPFQLAELTALLRRVVPAEPSQPVGL
ncbi:MAG: response regulator [Rhodospirillales bacterium]|nr:response regulator [Acetobacter sp.]